MRESGAKLSAAFCLASAGFLSGCASPTAEPFPVPPTRSVPPTQTPATATPEAEQKPAFELTSDIFYTGSQLLDVYYPTKPGPRPVIVMLHGAGGEKSQYAPGAEQLAARGAVVFVANWRSEPWVHGEMALMEDTACSIRFARSSAADYGGDPSHVVLFGHSLAGWSGATIALAGDEFTGDCPVVGVSAVPNVLVGYGGAYDAGESNPDGGASFLKEQDPELWGLIYPFAHIGSNRDTSFRLIAGDLEPHDIEVAERFLNALLAAGYDAEILVLEGAGHDGPAPGTAAFDAMISVILGAAEG